MPKQKQRRTGRRPVSRADHPRKRALRALAGGQTPLEHLLEVMRVVQIG